MNCADGETDSQSEDSPQERHHDNDQQDQAQPSAGVIAPASAVGPRR